MSDILKSKLSSIIIHEAAGKFPSDLINAADIILDSFNLVGKHHGDSKSIDEFGRLYPKGFTPPVDYIINPNNIDPETGIPVELGNRYVNRSGIRMESRGSGGLGPVSGKVTRTNDKIGMDGVIIPGSINFNALKPDPEYEGPFADPGPYLTASDNLQTGFEPIDTNDNYDKRIGVLEKFKSYSTKEFTHLLDYFIDSSGDYSVLKRSPDDFKVTEDTGRYLLSSFIRTTDDNEDPTMLGYDIIIKFNSSPLFNGTIDQFISQFKENSEVASRSDILKKFKSQLFKFLRSDSPSKTGKDSKISYPKQYYLKSLKGIDKLTDSSDSNELKSFVDYWKDFIELEFYEDVSQNIGYLSTLYKMLSYSRLNGKQVIPENLLRFDVDIVITEIRNYNRVIRDSKDLNKIDIYADKLSKYVYSLYECQFFFNNLPHGDSIDLSEPKMIDNYSVKFNYKFSTMKFSKFISPNENEVIINNAYADVSKIGPMDTNNSYVGNKGSIVNDKPINFLEDYDYYPKTVKKPDPGTIPEAKINQKYNSAKRPTNTVVPNIGNDKVFNGLEDILINAVATNVKVDIQAQLLNKTLENIRNQKTNPKIDVKKFMGPSVRSLFR